MVQVAVYGKGGIGKSTVSANISYSLSSKGRSVVQIGCDPKHDSTRLLMGGRSQRTVLEYIRDTPPGSRRLEDVLLRGTNGIGCVEAGGPEPGIGCAGRGILSTFDTLKKLGIDREGFDVRLYDVLGDVVCGGFAVPLRSEYSDAVFLVTSGEFMSVYAANNILRGIANYDHGRPTVAGLILNCRDPSGEEERVRMFADAVGLPVVAVIPRDGRFAESESAGRCLCEAFPDSPIVPVFSRLADLVCGIETGETPLYPARPVSDEGLAEVMRGGTAETELPVHCRSGFCVRRPGPAGKGRKDILDFCAAGGAVNATCAVSDLVTLIHGPMSCGTILTSAIKYTSVPTGFGPGIHMSERLQCTAMDDFTAIFGGDSCLRARLESLMESGRRNVVVVTTCTPGIIGDDAEGIAAETESRYPGSFVRVIRTDGNIAGDWIDGYLMAADVLSDMIDPDVEPEDGYVNLIAERYYHTEGEREEVRSLLEPFGLKVNCRFMNSSDTASIRGFLRGRYSLVFGKDPYSDGVAAVLREKFGVVPERVAVPRGMTELEEWIDSVSELTGRREEGERFRRDAESRYRAAIGRLRPMTEGRSCAVMAMFSTNLDWLLELLRDLGIGVELLSDDTREGILREGRYADTVGRFVDADEHGFPAEVARTDADFVLTDSVFTELDRPVLKYGSPWPGIDDIIEFADRLEAVAHLPPTEGWRL